MPEFGTFRDERDGHVYKTVKIGSQVWLAENLRFDCAGSMVYENNDKNLKRYGRLYDWRTAMNSAPEGWRLPSREDWNILTKHVGGEEVEGKALKSLTGWKKDGNGTDEYGFKALPGGAGFSDGFFNDVGYGGCWWSASEHGIDFAHCRTMGFHYDNANWRQYVKSGLYSVRLLRC